MDSSLFYFLRDLAERKRTSKSVLDRPLDCKGLVDNNGLTSFGYDVLRPYKVSNAVILAAGFSSRFAPLSYEIPKALLRVKGERLIERQILQLQAAGVNDITVVVGYKKELFLYLQNKFGVKLVTNEEFSSRNNHSSLMAVVDRLSNTYICSADNYFVENPFHSYELEAFYSVQYADGKTKEWCVNTAECGEITSVKVGGENAWYMIGHSYFDKKFSLSFTEYLAKVYGLEETKNKLWEELFIDNLSNLSMRIHKNYTRNIYEFDSLVEAVEFDASFFKHNPSKILDHIEKALSVERNLIQNVRPLKSGLTNLSCYFSVNGKGYVYRYPGSGTEKLVDRQAEFEALRIAKNCGFDSTFLAGDPIEGWKISTFIENARELNPWDERELKMAMSLMKRLHGQNENVSREFDFFRQGLKYEALYLENNESSENDILLKRKIVRLSESVETSRKVFTHNDFFGLNILIDSKGELNLIDWEYAGMGDYANDFGTFVVSSLLDNEQADKALNYYFGKSPTKEIRLHFYAHVVLASWCWYNWAQYKESIGVSVGNWKFLYREYALRYLNRIDQVSRGFL